VVGSYLYKGSHAHDCSTAGGFPENYDNRDTYNLLSVSLSNGGLGDWLPGMQGKGVGPLAMATDGKQLFVGGTFSGINGQGQQGFARFEAGPDLTLPGRPVAPKVSSVKTGTVSVRWTAVTDRDDGTLTYRLFRDAAAHRSTSSRQAHAHGIARSCSSRTRTWPPGRRTPTRCRWWPPTTPAQSPGSRRSR